MAPAKTPAESTPSSLQQHPLVDALRPDPSQPPADVTVLQGFLGKSPTAGVWRLYLTAALDEYVEIPEVDILFSQTLPNGAGTVVWVPKSLSLPHTKTQSQQVQADFLSGAIASRGLPAAGVATGATPQPTGQAVPSVHLICPTPTAVPSIHIVCARPSIQVICPTPSAVQHCGPVTLPLCPTETCPPSQLIACGHVTLPLCPTETCPPSQLIACPRSLAAPCGHVTLPVCPTETCVPTRMIACQTVSVVCPTVVCPVATGAGCPPVSLGCPQTGQQGQGA